MTADTVGELLALLALSAVLAGLAVATLHYIFRR